MTTPPQMYIGCACVVQEPDNEQNRYLLVRETKAIARGRLALPGGSLEAGETLEQAAIREVAEETGLAVDSLGLLGVFHCERTSENSFGVNFVFGARVVGGELTPSPEHPELVWLTADEIDSLQDDGNLRGAHLVEAVRRLQAGIYLPDGLDTSVDSNV